MTVNRNAQTASQANQFAVEDAITCIRTIQNIPAQHRAWIVNQIPRLGAVNNLHTKQNSLTWVVEVTTRFDGVRGNGERYRLTCMLDVDIPPPGSTQAPHFGWEIEVNGSRVGNGHVWLPNGVLTAGRPPPGVELDEYGYEGKLNEEFSGNGKIEMECSFRRYK